MAKFLICAVMLLSTIATHHAYAVIILGPSGRNTAAPDGELADSGWQYQSDWNGFLGTAISPNHFITAAHIEGSIGGTFTYQGEDYTAVSSATSPDADLRIWQIDDTLPDFAPLYTGSDEIGLMMREQNTDIFQQREGTGLRQSPLRFHWHSTALISPISPARIRPATCWR